MVALAFGAMWGFYGVTTWGWCLIKGYNITFGQWFNPVKPYTWDKSPELVPKGHITPVSAAAGGGQASAAAAVNTA